MYMITYKEDGTTMSVGSVDPAYNATPDAAYKSLWKIRRYARV